MTVTSASQEQQRVDLCPRLIDYVLVVGRRHPDRCSRHASTNDAPVEPAASSSAASSSVQNPELLRRYPTDDHKDFYLSPDVTYFCQPEGCITFGPRRMNTFRDTTSFVFTLTEKDSGKIRRGVCVNFYRPFERKVNTAVGGAKHKKKSPQGYTLTSLCLISHHAFFSTFRQILSILRRLIDASNSRACASKRVGGAKLSRDAVWEVLTGQCSDNIPSIVMHEIREIETWILRLLSAPVPVPGKTRVELAILPPELHEPLQFALPDHTRFSLVDFPLHLPLELLGVDSVVKVLTCIMLEYKVVLQSRDFNAVSMCVLALVSLLYPLEYMFPVIPLLPMYMAAVDQLLLAPTPYLIGLPASFFHHRRAYKLPNDVVLVDLDANRVVLPDCVRFPDMPEPENGNLINHLKQALASMSITQQPIHNLDALSDADRSKILSQQPADGMQPHAAFAYGNDSDAVDVATRVAMVKFFDAPNVLGSFTEHTRTLRLYPRPVVALEVDSFLRSRPAQSQFSTILARTQAVEYFGEWSLCPKNETYLRVHNGVLDPVQVGDKAKWFGHLLQTVEFKVYPPNSSLGAAWQLASAERTEQDLTDESGDSGSEGGLSSSGSFSSVDDLVFEAPSDFDPLDFGCLAKPLAEVDDEYHEPLALELPKSDSVQSLVESSQSSGRSSPSSLSTAALDSEGDFARLAENLALKSDATGGFSFDHASTSADTLTAMDAADETPVQTRKPPPSPLTKCSAALPPQRSHSGSSSSSTPTQKTPPIKTGLKTFNLGDSTEAIFGQTGTHVISAIGSQLNGYADRTQNALSEVLSKTGPTAERLKQKSSEMSHKAQSQFPTNRKSLVERSHLIKHGPQQPPSAQQEQGRKAADQQQSRESTERAGLQCKNQQAVKEICDAVLAGQGVGLLTQGKLRRLMADENLREIACAKLNLGLDRKHSSEEDLVQHSQVTRAQFKGMLKVLQACVAGITQTYFSPTAGGIASIFSVLEIAYTHHWTHEPDASTPSSVSAVTSAAQSLLGTPSTSMQDLRNDQQLGPSTFQRGADNRASARSDTVLSGGGQRHSQDTSVKTAPRPSRPPPPRQESIRERSKLLKRGSADAPTVAISAPPQATCQKSDSQCSEQSETSSSTLMSQGSTDSSHSTTIMPPQSLPMRQRSSSTVIAEAPLKCYLYQELTAAHPNPIWSNMQFWEDAYYDAVAHERDMVGLDQDPQDMIDRYISLSEADRKRLEVDEDQLLATLLHNMVAFMVICGTPRASIQQKARRILGKAHIGLQHSKEINALLDSMQPQQGNAVPLKPLGSRMMKNESFAVHLGSDAGGDILFMEVCDDAIVLRGVSGAVADRWWYERLVNMTYSPKTRVLCLWRRTDDKVQLHKFHTKKCRDLYSCIKAAMERAALRGKVAAPGRELGGEFPVEDMETHQGGLLQVRIDGVALLFADQKWFVNIANIKKCNTYGGNVFVLEEFDRSKKKLIQRRYMSQMADQICYAVLCVFSYVAAQHQKTLT